MKTNKLKKLVTTSGLTSGLASGLAGSILTIASLLTTPAIQAEPAKTIMQPEKSVMGVVGPRIVGGQPVTDNQARWITSLQYDGQHFCGGALISPSWVLTAAHCLTNESASDPALSVWVGGNDLRQDTQGMRVDVAEIINHENYNDSTLQNDIALLRLASPVSSEIQAANLATSAIMSGPAAPNQPVTVSGWGALAEGGAAPDTLHEVQVPVVSNAVCNAPESYAGEVSSKQICAGLRNGGKDSCQGDSGGPLWLNMNDRYYHVGIVSYGDGCAQPNKYGVYTRTQSYTSWVQAKLNGGTDNLPSDQNSNQNNDAPIINGPVSDMTNEELIAACSALFPQDQQVVDTGNGQTSATALNTFDQVFDLKGNANDQLLFSMDVAKNTFMLDISIADGEGDADLYVAHNRIPNIDDYDFAPFIDGNEETVSVESPTSGTWYIMIHGYDQFEGVSLNVFSF